jgi:fucose permease
VTGIVGGAVWPLLIGVAGDLLGLKAGMTLLFLSLGYILMIGFWAQPLVPNKTFEFRKAQEAKSG